MTVKLRREVGANNIDLEDITNGDLGNPLANRIITTSSIFWKSRFLHIDFALSKETASFSSLVSLWTG